LIGLNKITKEEEEKIREMLKLVEMERFENRLLENSVLVKKRLIELVRTILNSHKLLMLDEPVAGVNPRLRKIIANVLLKLKKQGKTILFIEHDMNFALSLADEVIVMDEGRVIARGKPKEIKNNPKVLEAYLGE
jgi:branched-chain amino acid transport system ATP-binding protein